MEVSNMDTLTVYRTPFGSVNSTVTGRYLAHNHLNRVGKAFLARDLSVGAKQMIEPTILQAAMLARVNVTYVHWAIKQMNNRFEIEAGFMPLVPPRIAKLKAPLSDLELFDFVRLNGVGRVLDAACSVEAAE
jgi:hypothetical protein